MPYALYGLYVLLTGAVAYGSTQLARSRAAGHVAWWQKVLSVVLYPARKADALTWIKDLTRFLTHHEGAVFQSYAPMLTSWFVGVNQYVSKLQNAVFSLPVTMVNTVYWLIYRHIPNAIRARTAPIARTAGAARTATKTQAKMIAANAAAVPQIAHREARSTVGTLEQPYVGSWEWLKAHWKGVTAAVALGGLAGVAGEMPYGLTIKNLRRELRKVKNLVTVAGLTGIGAIILSRLGLGGGRCNNTGKALKRVCGLDPNLLEAILADTLAVFGTISIVELAKGMQVLTPAARWGIGGLIREAPSEFENVPQDALDAALALIPGL